MNGAKGQAPQPSTNTPEQPSVGSMRTGGVNAYAPSSWNTNNGLGYLQQQQPSQGQGMNGAKGQSGGEWPAWSGGPHPLAVLAAHFINALGQGGGAESDSGGSIGNASDSSSVGQGEGGAMAADGGPSAGDDAAGP